MCPWDEGKISLRGGGWSWRQWYFLLAILFSTSQIRWHSRSICRQSVLPVPIFGSVLVRLKSGSVEDPLVWIGAESIDLYSPDVWHQPRSSSISAHLEASDLGREFFAYSAKWIHFFYSRSIYYLLRITPLFFPSSLFPYRHLTWPPPTNKDSIWGRTV